MKQHKKSLILLSTLLVTSIIISTQLSNATPLLKTLEETGDSVVDMVIYDADYGDYDGDGIEDDVQCYVNITFHQGINRKKFEMYTYLYLPNGDVYGYLIMVNTFRFEMTLHIVFYNHAYTPGDYAISIDLYLAQKGNYHCSTYIIFDPPTERKPDSEPSIEVCIT